MVPSGPNEEKLCMIHTPFALVLKGSAGGDLFSLSHTLTSADLRGFEDMICAIHAAPPRCILRSVILTVGQSNRINLPGVLIYGSLPLRRQFWMVPTEQFKRRASSSVSMNPSGAICDAGPMDSAVIATTCFCMFAVKHPCMKRANGANDSAISSIGAIEKPALTLSA